MNHIFGSKTEINRKVKEQIIPGMWNFLVYLHKVNLPGTPVASVCIHYHRRSHQFDQPIQQILERTNILPPDLRSYNWYSVRTICFHTDVDNRCRCLVLDTNSVDAHHKWHFLGNHYWMCMWRQLCNGYLDLDLGLNLLGIHIGTCLLYWDKGRLCRNDLALNTHRYLHWNWEC